MADENLFDAAVNTPAPTNPDDDAAIKSFLDEYVGEGKKYKSPEDLAKAYANAENHIGELRTDLTSLKEFMTAQFEQLGTQRNSPNPDPDQIERDKVHEPAPVAPPNGDGEEDLSTRIAKILEERDENKRLQKNAELAQDVMIEHFGSQEDAVKAIQAKANELGVNPQFLADTAFRSPQALFNMMGIDPTQKPRTPSTPNSSSDVNPRALEKFSPGPKAGTYGYYDQLRRTDPKKYWRTDVQAQMHKDAQALGSDFFKR